ncbi:MULTISPECIES: hypothetical protein [Myxococcus]|uniref:hypothetical protein n=1 Tax=Myxococcus TaxID=32 RepID=UPI00030B4583|nr:MULTISPECIES: hypothetical protein [Myxococcus]
MVASTTRGSRSRRERGSIEEYERLMKLRLDAPEAKAPAPGAFHMMEIRDHKRLYVEGDTA